MPKDGGTQLSDRLSDKNRGVKGQYHLLNNFYPKVLKCEVKTKLNVHSGGAFCWVLSVVILFN